MEEQCIIRFPISIADIVRDKLRSGELTRESMEINLDIGTRKGEISLGSLGKFNCVLVDLPTRTESYMTGDKRTYVKTADIAQMLVVLEEGGAVDVEFPDGLTRPMRRCRAKWESRKAGQPEKIRHLKQLLSEIKADNVVYEEVVIQEQEKHE